MCMLLCVNKCIFVCEKRLQKICGDTRGLRIGSSTSCNEEKSIRIPEAHNGGCRGSDEVAQKCQSRYTVQFGGHYVADGQHSTGKAKDLLISWMA